MIIFQLTFSLRKNLLRQDLNKAVVQTIFLFVLIILFIKYGQAQMITFRSADEKKRLPKLCDSTFYQPTANFLNTVQQNRPLLADSFFSERQHFLIHFTTEGKDSVAATDENQNFVPDIIETIGFAFEKSYQVEIEELGYPIPPTMQGGSAPYQVFVVDLNTSYAKTITVDVDSFAWEQQNVSSYILFDNDFIGHGYHIQGENAIKATAAHEFFHAIQLGLVFRKKDSFFFELSAVWMEDQVFDEVDNYLYFLDYFFSAPEIPLNGVSFLIPNVAKHLYGDCIFGFYIAENFGRNAIRDIWLQMPDKTALTAINQLFTRRGSNFENQFIKFVKWNFFTGSRALPEFSYDNGENYPLIKMETDTLIEWFHETTDAGYFLSSKYYTYQPLQDGSYSIQFNADYANHWRLGVLIWDDKLYHNYTVLPGENKNLETVQSRQKITVIPCNFDRFADPEKIYFKEDPEQYCFIFKKNRSPAPGTIKSFEISVGYPNPSSEKICFAIHKIIEANLNIKIYNIRGQQVDNVDYGLLINDVNYFDWDFSKTKSNLTSGVYFFKFSDGYFSEAKKIFLNR